jgi:hypothetical protein
MKLVLLTLSLLPFLKGFCSTDQDLFIPRQWSKEVHRNYLLQREQFIEEVALQMKDKTPFRSLLKKIGLWRRKIAFQSDEEHATKFGCLRTKGLNSLFSHLCLGCSDSVFTRAHRILDQTPDYYDPFWDGYKLFKMRYCQFYGDIDKEKIPLTRIAHLQTKVTEEFGEFFNFWGPDPDKALVWVHAETKYLEKILGYLDAVYQNILNAPKEDILSKLARWNWWYTQATPFYRGSAAIGEIFVLGVLKANNIPLKIKHKLLLDVEGLLEPNVELYILRYPEFFEVI